MYYIVFICYSNWIMKQELLYKGLDRDDYTFI